MGIEHRGDRAVYYRKRWRHGRVMSEYVASGDLAMLAYMLDLAERTEQQAQRRALQQLDQETASPAALCVFTAYVRDQVRGALEAAGYRQHHRGEWRRQRMGKAKQPTAIIGPQPFDDWATATMAAMNCADPPPAVLADYHRLMRLCPSQARENGDLAQIARREIRTKSFDDPRIAEAVSYQASALLKSLGAEGATPMEKLLIDLIVLDWEDYHTHMLRYNNRVREGLSLDALEQWERILRSKESRYKSAIETLARVRRLLKLPAVQVNIGGQQVNINGT
jgi:hypothetical protein